MEIDVSDGIVALGKRGSGKTYLIKKLITRLPYRFCVIDVVGNMKELQGNSRVEYHLTNPHNSDMIDSICMEAMEKGNQIIVCDEADRIAYTTRFSDVINLGRNYNVGYLASARRTANISKDILANQSHAFVFRHTYPRDVAVLNEWLETEPEKLRMIPQYNCMYFNNDQYVRMFRA